jgi:hypothetical protein
MTSLKSQLVVGALLATSLGTGTALAVQHESAATAHPATGVTHPQTAHLVFGAGGQFRLKRKD